ncbi:MAG: formylglycine-generating enzyme family protein, partial [bacterium]|nr:formylglycine-generating enzyme family protein [bacterium]
LGAAGIFGGLLAGGLVASVGPELSAPRVVQRNRPARAPEITPVRVAGKPVLWRIEAAVSGIRVAREVRGGAEVEVVWEEVAEAINPIDDSVLVYVPGGEYTLGAEDLEELFVRDFDADDAKRWASWSLPVHRVNLSAFRIGKYPVTNAQYRAYLDVNSSIEDPEYWTDERFNQDMHPVVGVDWGEASAYCRWAGMKLPSEAQWEAAARGTDQRRYPWGDEPPPSEELAHFGLATNATAPVDAHPKGVGPYGTLDQAGNVWEWCLDTWDEDAYKGRDGQNNPVNTSVDTSAGRVWRGGAWGDPAGLLAAALRNGAVSRIRDPS